MRLQRHARPHPARRQPLPVFLNPQSRASNPRIVTVFVRDKEGSFFTPIRPSFHLIVAC